MPPDISILITTRDNASPLRQTLEAMQAVAVPDGLTVELVVVDNASINSETAQVMRECGLKRMPARCISEPTPGKSQALNSAIASTRSPIVVLTDDDVRPSACWLVGMTAPLLDGRADAVAGGVCLAPHVLRPWMQKSHRTMLAENLGEGLGEGEGTPSMASVAVVGANFAFCRAVLSRVPAFDPELGPGALGFADDTLFGYQLRAAGYRVADGTATTVEHHPDTTRLKRSHYVDHAARLGRSFGYLDYHWKHETVPALPLRKLKAAISLWRSRGRLQRDWNHDEGAPQEEIVLLYHLHRYRQYQIEARKPRHYDRHGLVRRKG